MGNLIDLISFCDYLLDEFGTAHLACIHQCLENDDCSPGDLEEVEPEMLTRRMEEGSFKIKGRCLFILSLLLKNLMPMREQMVNDVASDLMQTFQFQALCLAHVCAKVLDAKGRANKVLEQINAVGLLQGQILNRPRKYSG
jgi:hypothetical protein